jgi:hypothetical protein
MFCSANHFGGGVKQMFHSVLPVVEKNFFSLHVRSLNGFWSFDPEFSAIV